MSKHTPTPWTSMRDGNQYVRTRYMPTSECVGASRIPELCRPWNPHALLAFGFEPKEYETARFLDDDADFIVRACNAHEGLVKALQALLDDCMLIYPHGLPLDQARAALAKARGAGSEDE